MQQPIPSQPSYFFLHPAAVAFSFNALGDPDNLGISVYSNAQVLFFVRGIDGLDQLPDSQYRSWTLSAYPTHFTDDAGCARYCHIALSKTTSQATLCFPDTRLDIYGRSITDDGQFFLNPDGSIVLSQNDTPEGDPSPSEDGATDLTPNPDHYFLFLGKITASGPRGAKQSRRWDNIAAYPITGTLDTAQYREYEQGGDLDKMFRFSPLYGNDGAILQLLPIVASRIWQLFIGTAEKVVNNLFRRDDLAPEDIDAPVEGGDSLVQQLTVTEDLDTVLPTEAHMRDYIDRKALSRKHADTAQGTITFADGVRLLDNGHQDVAMLFGSHIEKGTSGSAVWVDEGGSWHAQFDFLRINKKATFQELEIQKMSHIGGAYIQSAASCTIDHVASTPDDETEPAIGPRVVRCYFLSTDGDRKITNNWKPLDQAICKTFNLVSAADGSVSNHYWWRIVTAVGSNAETGFHYIDVSIDAADTGSDLPEPGDEVILLGSRSQDPADTDRTNAIIQAAAGEGSPYTRYYKHITSFLMPKPRINLECEHPSLDVDALTITASDGSKTNVGEALDAHFNIYSLDVPAEIDDSKQPGEQGYFIDPVLGTEGWPENEEHWVVSDYPNHVNDVAICTNSAYFRFTANDDGTYGWHNITDQVLIEAIRTAQAALFRLTEMADDNKITPEEKVQLNERLIELEAEGSNIIQEASYYSIATKNFSSAYNSLLDFIRFILREAGTTDLVDSEGKRLSQMGLESVGSATTYTYSYVVPGGISQHVTYTNCVRTYYQQLSILRKNITQSVKQYVDDKSFASADQITQDLKNNVDNLWRSFSDWCQLDEGTRRSLIELNGDVLTLSEWAKNGTNIVGSGFITESNYAAMFSVAKDADGHTLAEALANTYVSHTSDGWISGFKIEANEIVINTDNFKIDRNGDVTVYGELDVKSMQQHFLDVTNLAKDEDGATFQSDIIIAELQDKELSFIDIATQQPLFPWGFYNLVVTGRTVILPTDKRYIGQRIILYDANDKVSGGTHSVTQVRIDDGLVNTYSTIPFRGVGIRNSSQTTPEALWDYKKVHQIDFVNGAIEFLGVPSNNSTTDWLVINIATKSVLFRDYQNQPYLA